MDGKELRRRYTLPCFATRTPTEAEPDCIDSYKPAAGEDRRGPCGPRALAACEAHATASSIFFWKEVRLWRVLRSFFKKRRRKKENNRNEERRLFLYIFFPSALHFRGNVMRWIDKKNPTNSIVYCDAFTSRVDIYIFCIGNLNRLIYTKLMGDVGKRPYEHISSDTNNKVFISLLSYTKLWLYALTSSVRYKRILINPFDWKSTKSADALFHLNLIQL